jgi:hypothetical protein
MEVTPLSDEDLYAMMLESPECANLPKPATWYKKFKIQPVKARNFKEYLDDDAWMKARGMYVDSKEIRKEPVPGGVRAVLPSEVIPMEIISRPLNVDEVWGLEEQQKKEREERESKYESCFKVSEILSEASTVTPQ